MSRTFAPAFFSSCRYFPSAAPPSRDLPSKSTVERLLKDAFQLVQGAQDRLKRLGLYALPVHVRRARQLVDVAADLAPIGKSFRHLYPVLGLLMPGARSGFAGRYFAHICPKAQPALLGRLFNRGVFRRRVADRRLARLLVGNLRAASPRCRALR